MDTVFDKPQWRLTEATAETVFAYVRTELTATSWRGKNAVRYINVPATFFTMCESLLNQEEIELARRNTVSFFLMQIEDRSWVFGFAIMGTDKDWFLWRYTENNVPGWLVSGL